MSVEARPVRTPASSLRTNSIWPSMRFLISACRLLTSVASMTVLVLSGHDRADGFAHYDAPDVALRLHVEDQDRQLVVHAQRDRGGIHHLEAFLQHLQVRNAIVARRIGMLDRIGGVNP